MKKQNFIFLVTGFAFGILVGAGALNAWVNAPAAQAAPGQPVGQAAIPNPAGPMSPTQMGQGAAAQSAPMVPEINRLKRELQEDPRRADVAIRLAHLYHDASMWDQAVPFYEKALAVEADNPDWLTDLGICYRELGRHERAMELFGQARQADPDHWQSAFNTAVVAIFDLGDLDLALEMVQELERIDTGNPRVAQLRQALEQAAGQGK